jgi:hypothetical protein
LAIARRGSRLALNQTTGLFEFGRLAVRLLMGSTINLPVRDAERDGDLPSKQVLCNPALHCALMRRA